MYQSWLEKKIVQSFFYNNVDWSFFFVPNGERSDEVDMECSCRFLEILEISNTATENPNLSFFRVELEIRNLVQPNILGSLVEMFFSI